MPSTFYKRVDEGFVPYFACFLGADILKNPLNLYGFVYPREE